MIGDDGAESSVGRSVSLGRRDLLRLLGTGVLGASGTGLATGQSDPNGADQGDGGDDGGESDRLGWNASHTGGFQVDADQYKEDLYRRFYVTTSHSVTYLGATWDPFTTLCDVRAGAWQHTFVVSNFGTGFENRPPDYVPGDAVTGAAYFFDGSKFAVVGGPDTSTDLSDDDIEAEYNKDCTGWSLRFDKDQHYWLNPVHVENWLTDNSELRNEIEKEQRESDYSLVENPSVGASESLTPRQFVGEEDAIGTLLEGTVATAMGESLERVLVERGVSSPLARLKAGILGIGIELTTADWDLIFGNDDITNMYEGVTGKYDPGITPAHDGTEHPNPNGFGKSQVDKSPGTGMSIYFDVYVAPDTETTFSVTSGIRGIKPDEYLYAEVSNEPQEFVNAVENAREEELRTHPTWQIEIESHPAPPRDEAGELTGPLRTEGATIQAAYDDMDDSLPTSRGEITPRISADPLVGYPGYEITFDASNSDFASDPDWQETYDLTWRFEDGTTLTSADGAGLTVTHSFDGVGEWDVELEVVDKDGKMLPETADVSVEIERLPTIQVEQEEPVGVNQEVHFTLPSGSFSPANASIPSSADIEVEWAFGDGTTSQESPATHVYEELPDETEETEDGVQKGTYTVTMDMWVDGELLTDAGEEHTDTHELEIRKEPFVAPTIEVSGPAVVGLDVDHTFEATLEDPEGSVSLIQWFVNTDQPVGAGNEFTTGFSSTGEHQVTAEAGGEGPTISDSVEVTVLEHEVPDISIEGNAEVEVGPAQEYEADVTDPDDVVEEIQWRRDGTNLQFGETYEITFDEVGSFDIWVEAHFEMYRTSDNLTVQTYRQADPTLVLDVPDMPAPGTEYTYEVDVTDPQNEVSEVRWLSDGQQVGTGRRLDHTFETTGSKPMTVEAADETGVLVSKSFDVYVPDRPTDVSIELQKDVALVNDTARFEASVSDPGNVVESIDWFVDGSEEGSGDVLEYVPTSTGTLDLRVVANYGAESIEGTHEEQVYEQPSLDIVGAPSEILVGTSVDFEADITDPGGAVIGEVQWSVNGAQAPMDFGPDFSWTFDNTGTDQVTAKAIFAGDAATDTVEIEVVPEPTVEIDAGISDYMVPDITGTYEADVTDPAGVVGSITWTAETGNTLPGSGGDLATGTGTSFSHAWDYEGTYTVTVEVEYGDKTSSDEIDVEIEELSVM